MSRQNRAHWKLPAGVTRGLWDYVHSDPIAWDYDDYFAYHRMFDVDQQAVREALDEFGGRPGDRVADLGCGTGRGLLPLVRDGYRGLAIDLSRPMLDVVRSKAVDESLAIDCLRANLVDLSGLADNSVDHAISLFSTIGMIQGRANRRAALGHVHRILRSGGVLVLHAHNYWFNLRDLYGPWLLLQNAVRATLRRDWELGDRYFNYRGVNNMFLHVFRKGELRRDLVDAGFRIRRWMPLHPKTLQSLAWPWLAGWLRTIGWIVVCTA